jgi:hypothetical protein
MQVYISKKTKHFSSLHRPLLPTTHLFLPHPETWEAPLLYVKLRDMKEKWTRRKEKKIW